MADTTTLSLLKLPAAEGDVFFVVNNEHIAPVEDTDAGLQATAQYHYEEHSCPINWLDSVVEVIQNGDEDPHGFLEHVRSVRVSANFKPTESWREVFPEAFPVAGLLDANGCKLLRHSARQPIGFDLSCKSRSN